VTGNVSYAATFIVARNPEEDTKLPFLVHLPVDGGPV
jgi:hypothetical protein